MDNRGTGRTTRQLLEIFKSIPNEERCMSVVVFVTHNQQFAKYCFDMYRRLMHDIGSKNFTARANSLEIVYDNWFIIKFTGLRRESRYLDEMTIGYKSSRVVYDHAAFWAGR
jgi:hypothetical protein